MRKLHPYIWLAITIVFAVGITFLALSYIVTQPGHIIPVIGGDGAKNNFTYLYHAMFGKGYWFAGMNYPYGEHIVYTDGQPLLSVWLAARGNVSAPTGLAILWTLYSISYALSIIYVYKSLIHFQIPPWASVLFAGLIGVYSPQLFCMAGHYALAYLCVIPMIFYWTLKFAQKRQLKYCVWLFIIGCLSAFLHPYYAAMLLVWAGAYTAASVLTGRGNWFARALPALPVVAASVAVLAVVGIVMKATDPTTDRPVSPLNSFYETCSRPKHLLTSIHSPFWVFAKDNHWIHSVSAGSEGYAYPGLVVIATLLLVLGALAVARYKKRAPALPPSTFPRVWIVASLIILALSMGLPFILYPDMLDYLSAFRQFRSMGRFSWMFYYVIAIYAATVIYQQYQALLQRSKKIAAYSVLLGAFGIWGFEASAYIKFSRDQAAIAMYHYDIIFSTYEQPWKAYLQEKGRKPDDFQAILLMPFFHVGTEKLWISGSEWVITLGTKAALQLHLPIVDVMLSRSSWSQAMKQVKIAAGPYAQKPSLADMKSNKPLLMLHFDEDSLDAEQGYLRDAAEYIGHYSQCHVYALYPERLLANDKRHADSIRQLLPLLAAGKDTALRGGDNWYVAHYDGTTGAERLFGKGSLRTITTTDTIIAELPIKRGEGQPQEYELSCWFLLGKENYRSPFIKFYLMGDGNDTLADIDMLVKQSTDNHGMWFRGSKQFRMPAKCRLMRCQLKNDPNPSYFAMDELMLRPINSVIVSKSATGEVMVNNHLFGR